MIDCEWPRRDTYPARFVSGRSPHRRQIKPGYLAPEAAGHRLQFEAGWVIDGAYIVVHWTACGAGEGSIDEEANINGLVRLPIANPERRMGDVRIWIGRVCWILNRLQGMLRDGNED